MKKRILSGMRPTGQLHIGHLVGALDNWIKLQDQFDCFFMVADWHALMSEYENPREIKKNILENVCDWISCGIDPEKAVIFVQSHVGEHLDLAMIFSCITPLGWLERCPTYKEQIKELKGKDVNNYAFLGYPVLQAADILLYKAEVVPVGKDQLPHLELTREIARRFNSLYKKELFPEPKALLTESARLMGLDGRKMSKSYNNTINLSDKEIEVEKKVMQMITDPKRIKLFDRGNPDVCNVYSYYNIFCPEKKEEVRNYCIEAKVGCTKCKKQLAGCISERLAPIQQERKKILKDKGYLGKILHLGAEKAKDFACLTVGQAKELVHFYV
ncbi:MAG: tryptophan--tRNA ligase [Candidatus Gygaella obscura]|nr:tryptophan--tRNA ligase [Candidatus Gygaella obscura]